MPKEQTQEQAKPQAETQNKTSSAGAKVTVACKLPHGLILRVFEARTAPELVHGGGSRTVRTFWPTGESVRLNGNTTPYGVAPTWPIVGGYGLTQGVSKDLWDAWLEQNKGSAVVKGELVFAYEKAGMVEGRATEQIEIKSGLEPLDPAGDPRAATSPNKNLHNITEEEQRAKSRAA